MVIQVVNQQNVSLDNVFGLFPLEWKIGNFLLVYKKGGKQWYRPVSLLPIRSKIFENLIFNEMFKFFNEFNLISSK